MRRLYPAILVLTAALVRADVVTLWDFNSLLPDSDPATGQFEPAYGTGFAQPETAAASFRSVASGATSDPNLADNSQLRLSSFPTQGTLNKTAGITFFTSTDGFENILLRWDHYNSGTASRYWRVQYTIDAINWIDHAVVTNTRAGAWLLDQSVSFHGLPGVDNNPDFGCRIVAEFAGTATGEGSEEYLPVNADNYSRAGTFWLDMVAIQGDLIWDGNTPPGIAVIPGHVTRVNTPISIPLTIGDAETPLEQLSLEWWAELPHLITNGEFAGTDSERTLALTPAADQVGSTLITVRVMDEQGRFTERSFALDILPQNTPPFISTIAEQEVVRGASLGPIQFSIGDLESEADALSLTCASSNPSLIPVENISLQRTGPDCAITILPGAVRVGATIITLTAHDGELESTTSFLVRVLPPNLICLWDFNSNPPDEFLDTGTLAPAQGAGAFIPAGIVTNSFGRVGTGGSSDPATSDDSMLRVGGFPAQGSGNKKCGFEVRVSTVGRRNIALVWDQYNSNTASRYWRLQYSTNGIEFVDHELFTNTMPVTWLKKRVIDFSDVPGANNNPDFALRFVSEFESTATGTGENRYVPVNETSNYSVAGTLWLDHVALAGDPMEAPVAPQLSIHYSDGQIELSWPAVSEFQLESTASLSNPAWTHDPQNPLPVDDKFQVLLPAEAPQRFFRLTLGGNEN